MQESLFVSDSIYTQFESFYKDASGFFKMILGIERIDDCNMQEFFFESTCPDPWSCCPMTIYRCLFSPILLRPFQFAIEATLQLVEVIKKNWMIKTSLV